MTDKSVPGSPHPAPHVPVEHVPGENVPGAPLAASPLPAEHVPAEQVPGSPVPADHVPDRAVYENVPYPPGGAPVAHPQTETRQAGDHTLIPRQTEHAALDVKAARAAKADQKAADKEVQAATDHFAKMHGDFLNSVDALGDTYATRMAKASATQAMEWVHLHLHPDPLATIPNAPPAAPAVPR